MSETDIETAARYAAPRDVTMADCWFYHTMELPGFGLVPGVWDLRGRAGDYTGHVEVAGKRVLDIGTASGFLTFAFERQGAEVVSFDADLARRYAVLPFRDDLAITDRAAWELAFQPTVEQRHNGYWLAHRALGSNARAFYGDVYDLPAWLGAFDVVMVGQILVHLSDPIRAMESIARHCRDRLVITEGMLDEERPIMQLATTLEQRSTRAWWHISIGLYRTVLAMMGFEIERIGKGRYKVSAPGHPDEIELTTIVARRT
ncbi:MAG: methyltransferase domain-containing protein [Rhodospirillaceae bacterium]|nr:methyltransferase domain-containing protein [Rhodospirillaceae bacterium]